MHFISEMVMYVSEPQNITLTVTRQGKIDAESRVHYRTLDGSASFLEGDYIQIPTTLLLFSAGQRERSIQVSVLDDNIPEGNETFSVQLFDVAGQWAFVDFYICLLGMARSNGRAYDY